ncbi:MAG TPA: hypothetical protein VLF14_04920 [Candidatus Binatia bacterium]|nr:hypothetical protein [Candidatus Binatia bacterium]
MSERSSNGVEPIAEEFLDCTGRKRTFLLRLYAGDQFLEAVEMRPDERAGSRFVLPVKFGEAPPWGQMRDLVRRRLASRDVVRDEHGRLEILTRTIRAQISDAGEYGLVLLVDDVELTWEEFGRLLGRYAGWNLRVEIRDPAEGD